MITKPFQGLNLSSLGLGCMRLPTVEGKDTEIDVEQTRRMVAYAMENGINYYDTAWGYHGGNSEIVMGEILSEYPRNTYFLATKFPGYDVGNFGKVEEIFKRQQEKLRTDYFDFYLFHNICEKNIDYYLNPAYKTKEYLAEQKKQGKIRHLGCSVHGDMTVMKRFFDAYGDLIEFCQIQLNWLDWDFQAAKEKVAFLNERNIPIWVMEPLRGGKLARVMGEDARTLTFVRPGKTLVDWAFRYLQSIPGVTMILSGMSDEDQLRENIEIFRTDEPLGNAEKDLLHAMGKRLSTTVPCTACRYCISKCPKGLDIPKLLELYNEHKFSNGFMAPMVLSTYPDEKKPSACIGCRSCESVCPQRIKISEALKDFKEILG